MLFIILSANNVMSQQDLNARPSFAMLKDEQKNWDKDIGQQRTMEQRVLCVLLTEQHDATRA